MAIAGQPYSGGFMSNHVTETAEIGPQEMPLAAGEPVPSAGIRDVLIVGSGPAGLAAAIAASRAGLQYEIVEKGVLVNSIYKYPTNMVFFTTPELLEIGGLPFTTPYFKPTRVEALSYYRRVADSYRLKIAFGERVRHLERQNGVFTVTSQLKDGREHARQSRFVVVATGYYDNPNLLEVPGESLPHVSHYFSEAHGYYRKRVAVVGGNNSASETALELFRGGAEVTLIHRGPKLGDHIKYWVRPDIENRIKEGSIGARFNARVVELLPTVVRLEVAGRPEEVTADAVFLLTGYHPDTDFLRSFGVMVTSKTSAPSHDPETFETSVPGLFLAGAVVSGKDTNQVFIENGRFHGERAIRTICQKMK
jgi:thioredoxin reductase (NADPH)